MAAAAAPNTAHTAAATSKLLELAEPPGDVSSDSYQMTTEARKGPQRKPVTLRLQEKKESNNSVDERNMTRATTENNGALPPRGLKRYKILSLIGDGTYGLVYLAFNSETKEKVAIKTMKRRYHSWDEVMELREVKSLKKLHHPNVVKLKEVIRENSRLYFVFEYIRGDLLGLMRERGNEPFPETWIRSLIFQLLQGLSYMHRLGFFHRDLKPENILTSGPDMVKIADFGLAREIRSAPPYTDYVSTRWYRAPEVLLRSTGYNSPIDVWAVGCITAELYTKRPLFPGTSEIDQLYKICSILGTPGRQDWQEGFSLANVMSFKFPTFTPTHLSQVLGPRTSARTVSFLYTLLPWNPGWRSSAQEALKHAFFRGPKGVEGAASNSGGIVHQGGANRVEEVAGAAVSIANKRNTNARVLNEEEEDYERLRDSLRHHKPKVAQSKSLDELTAKSQLTNPNTNAPLSNAHSQVDVGANKELDDLSDLISAFGISPDVGKRKQQQIVHAQRVVDGHHNVANPPSFKVARRMTSRDEETESGYKTTSLKSRMPRFSNFDEGSRQQQHHYQQQQQRARMQLQLQLSKSYPDEPQQHHYQQPQQKHSPKHQYQHQHHPTRDEEEERLLSILNGGPQISSAISAAMPKLNGGTKYTALYRQHSQSDPLVNSGFVNGQATAAIPVYAAAATNAKTVTAANGYTPSFGGSFNSTTSRQPQQPSNGVVSNGFAPHHNNTSNNNSSNRAVTFSTNKALAATSPLYADKTNLSSSPFRSLPDFKQKQLVGNGVTGNGIGNGHVVSKTVTEKQKPRPVIHVRTNWAAKYLK